MNMSKLKSEELAFASKIGAIAAAAGSAVGLGNLWRFPSQTAGGGGALFIIIYLVCVIFFGLPLLISELMVGRASKQNAASCFQVLAPKSAWKWVGIVAVISSVMVLGYYVVVCAWTLDYIWQSVSGCILQVTDFEANFADMLNDKWRQWILMVIFCMLTAAFILGGVKKGIESSAKIMMPLLFLLLIALAIRAMTLPGASEGLIFLFKPDFSKINGSVLLSALGQTFFSLSLGMGCLLTYGAYCSKDMNLPKSAVTVVLLDTLVALLAGMMIFPSAFALAAPGEDIRTALLNGGPGLLFVTVPKLFMNLPGSAIWATIFFLLTAIAALTSTISLMEVSTVAIHQKLGWSRRTSTIVILILLVIMGTLCTFSPKIFDWSDFISAKTLMPFGGLFVSLFVGWRMDRNLVKAQFTNEGKLPYGGGLLKAYSFILRYVAPVMILIIFITGVL